MKDNQSNVQSLSLGSDQIATAPAAKKSWTKPAVNALPIYDTQNGGGGALDGGGMS